MTGLNVPEPRTRMAAEMLADARFHGAACDRGWPCSCGMVTNLGYVEQEAITAMNRNRPRKRPGEMTLAEEDEAYERLVRAFKIKAVRPSIIVPKWDIKPIATDHIYLVFRGSYEDQVIVGIVDNLEGAQALHRDYHEAKWEDASGDSLHAWRCVGSRREYGCDWSIEEHTLTRYGRPEITEVSGDRDQIVSAKTPE